MTKAAGTEIAESVRFPEAQSEATNGVESMRSWPLEMLRTRRLERKRWWSMHESRNPGREQSGPMPKGKGTFVEPQSEGQSALGFEEVRRRKRKEERE